VSAIFARGLTKRYETGVAIDGVDLVVGEGEVRGLLGPNGAGKTTLLRMLLGLIRPDAGTIELLGHDGTERPCLDRVAGFVESPGFYPYLSGRANLEVLAELDRDGSRTSIEEVLRRVELDRRADDRVNGYSSGMRQRLGIAASLLRDPKLLLLDEPTSGLDPAGVRLMSQLIRELATGGVAVLIASHQIGEVERTCDSFTVLHHARKVWEGSLQEMRRQAPPSTYVLHTSDDAGAFAIASRRGGILAQAPRADGLTLVIEPSALDAFSLELGRSGIAVRRLQVDAGPLESMFFALTEHPSDDGDRHL
jgi:ABC-2 type transport system ATP-binding protein